MTAQRDSVAIPGVSLCNVCIAKSLLQVKSPYTKATCRLGFNLLGGCRDALLRLTHGIDSSSQADQWLLVFGQNTASPGKDIIRGLQRSMKDGW